MGKKKTDSKVEQEAEYQRVAKLLPEHLSPILPKSFKIGIGANVELHLTIAGNDIVSIKTVDKMGYGYPPSVHSIIEIYSLKQYQKDTKI